MNKHPLASFFSAFLLLSVFYRIIFLMSSESEAHSAFNVYHHASVSLGCLSDLLTGGLLTGLLFIICKMVKPLVKHLPRIQTSLYYAGIVFLYVLIFCLACIDASHKRLFFEINLGFSYPLFITSIQQGFSPNQYEMFMTVTDWIFILSAPVWLTLCLFASTKKLSALNAYVLFPFLSLGILAGVLFFVWYDSAFSLSHEASYFNPFFYANRNLYQSLMNPYARRKDLPIPAQLNSVAFIDPIFGRNMQTKMASKSPHQKRWNVVMVILESTGSSYLFQGDDQTKVPMPFLQNLRKQGLWLDHNYSVGNTSTLGAFGLFTGLYPLTAPVNFSVRRDVVIPNIGNYLDANYEKLFVSATNSRYYFPEDLIKHGFPNFIDSGKIPHNNAASYSNIYMDERVGFQYFMDQLKQMKSPYFAVYWSCAAHYPYWNYGSDELISYSTKSRYKRYLKNLFLLDTQLQALYTFLKKEHRLENTILVIAGDHGESFGQHGIPGNYAHGTSVFEEQVRVPVLFYQPALFAAREITTPTSSIDILPTLLDAMHVPYRKANLQGQSLLHPNFQNRYIFIYGDENEVTAIKPDLQKMVISFAKGQCSTYQLKTDPLEEHPLDCSDKNQELTIIKFRNYQTRIIPKYNLSLSKKAI